ncbi:PA0069 family radical SAM protein [Roseitranquillus sediminis]|uniref:PA0069 family radical SAM protein n=1 Tax=Roseitranquillus sediminis TaxID=2809051 RepID=UPI001D0C0892|nr:PA0069 family radical SAM protein [Roseitranquillus sediminis]MBM9595865.1 PA0069 family radical SAM protein [Roseitranquillus sediminis]
MEAGDIEPGRRRGRGARTNRSGRYESLERSRVHDGWEIDEPLPPLRTEVSAERPRAAITRNGSPDIPFDRSINPYRGCEHGCIYCFARPTHAWLGLSPGLDFETRLVVRPEMPRVLERELRRKRYVPAPIAIGTNTDPYQPVEAEHRVMRQVLEVLRDFRHPVTIATKGTLVERDLDILSEMARLQLVQVGITVTTLDRVLSRALEPRVPLPQRRLATLRRLAEAGIPVRIMISPVIPGLTCNEIEALVEAGRDAGARAVSWAMLRLPLEVAPLFREWLAEHRPERAARVMARVRESHGGRDYDPEWGRRMKGQGTYAELLASRFRVALRRAGLDRAMPELRCDLFAPPTQKGDQLRLL